MDWTCAQQEVVEIDCRHTDTEGTDTHANTLGTDVIIDIGGGEECVAVDFQTIVLVKGLAPFLSHLGGVGCGEDKANVVDIVVDLVTTDAVVHLHALHDGIVHLCTHLLIGGGSEIGDDENDS